MTTLFAILSTVIFGLLFIIWSNKTNLNLLFKSIFFVMTVFGILQVLTNLGYVVQQSV